MRALLRLYEQTDFRHIQFVTKERTEYAMYRNRAVRKPAEVCSIIIDGADQAAYGLPHFIHGTKNLRGDAMKVDSLA